MSYAKWRSLWSSGLATFGFVVVASLSPVAFAGCSGGDDDATGPAANPCSEAVFSSRAEIGFNLGCTSYSSSISGITYDQFSRVTSYNYDISCTGGGSRRAGRVYNITYNNLGDALSWDYTVNGATCRKS